MRPVVFSEMFSWYRNIIQGKTRILSAWIFVALLAPLAQSPPDFAGMWIAFAGSLLRFWASGYLKKDNQLTFEGPYSYCRNPLYLGTYLMAAGTLLSLKAWVACFFFSGCYFGLYHFIILDEETKLIRLFGFSYQKYFSLVPRFFPTRGPLPALSHEQKLLICPVPAAWQDFSWSIAMKNKAFESLISWVGIYGYIYLVLAAKLEFLKHF